MAQVLALLVVVLVFPAPLQVLARLLARLL
jgi:hypothetical protein